MKPWLALALAAVLACKSEKASETKAQPVAKSAGYAAPSWGAERELPVPAADQHFPRPMLWTATKYGKVMHVFGLLHSGIDVTKRLPPWIWTLFDASTLLVQELDIEALEQASWPTAARSLRAELGEDDWRRLLEVCASPHSLDKERIFRVALIVASVGVVVPDPLALPMDAYFLQRAKKLGHRLLFLETAEFQTTIIKDLMGIDTLRALIRNREALRELNRGYYDAYLNGDQDGWYKISLDAIKLGTLNDHQFTHYVDRLLFSRNHAWIQHLEKVHADYPSEGVFVAVGALHLIGPSSVLELLRARGFSIEQAHAP